MSEDIEITLGTRLHDVATAFDVPGGDLGTTVKRGRRRVMRRRRTVAAATAVTVAATTAAGVRLIRSGDEPAKVVVGSPGSGGMDIDWARVEPGSALGTFATGLHGEPGGPLFALSTAPGDASFEPDRDRVLWRSDDGVEWEQASTLDGDLSLADLAVADGRVYAVGTSVATADVSEGAEQAVVVAWSDDEGESWNTAPLPIDVAAIAEVSPQDANLGYDAQVAAGPAGTVAVVLPRVYLDVPSLLPGGATAPYGWVTTDDGVDVLLVPEAAPCPAGSGIVPPGQEEAIAEKRSADGIDPNSRAVATPSEVGPVYCYGADGEVTSVMSAQEAYGVTAAYTWDDLGVSGDALRAARGAASVFHAAPGSADFERVEVPAVPDHTFPMSVEANEGGFDLVLAVWGPADHTDDDSARILHSDDGRGWADGGELPGDLTWVAASGTVGGRATFVGNDAMGSPVQVRSDGTGGWVTTPLPSQIDGIGDSGMSLFLAGADVGPSGVAVVLRGESPVERDRPSDPDGLTEYPAGTTREDTEAIELALTDHLLVSRDGTSWHEESIDDLAGEDVIPMRVTVRDEQVVVETSRRRSPGSEEPSERVTLVGTMR